MNKKFALLLPSAIALALVAAPIFPVVAEVSNAPVLTAQKRGQKLNLNLTADQKARMKQIREATKAQMDAVFTPEQKAQLQAAKQQGTNRREVMRSLNLTEDQKNRLWAIREQSKQQFEAILTAEQQQQLQQRRQNRPMKPAV
jgi:Spy/CpxP family protein refolding chaperone